MPPIPARRNAAVSGCSGLSLLIALVLMWPPGAYAAQSALEIELAESRAQLHNLRQRMDRWLVAADEREREVNAELQRREARIESLGGQLAEIRARQASAEVELQRLKRSDVVRDQTLENAETRLLDAGKEIEKFSAKAKLCEHELVSVKAQSAFQRSELEKLGTTLAQQQARQDGVDGGQCVADLERELMLNEAQQRRLAKLSGQIRDLRRAAESSRVSLQSANGTLRQLQAERQLQENRAESATAALFVTKQRLAETRSALALIQSDTAQRMAATRSEAAANAAVAGRDYRQRTRQAIADVDNPEMQKAAVSARARLFDEQTRLAQLSSARGVYTVRPGDTLSKLSRTFIGDPGGWTEIFAANQHVIEQPDTLLPGLVLVIP